MKAPYYEKNSVKLYLGDALTLLPELEPGSFAFPGIEVGALGVVITDPPYNAGKKYGEQKGRISWVDWTKWIDSVFDAWTPLADETFMFLSQVAYREYIRRGTHSPDWDSIWYKPLSMAVCAAPYMPHWEHIAYYGKRKKGQRRHADGRFVKHADGGFGSDVFIANVETGTERYGHPTPKPMRLLRELVGRCARDAAFIVDPFAGSCTTLGAAMELDIPAVGFELFEEYAEQGARRLDDIARVPYPELIRVGTPATLDFFHKFVGK